MPWPKGKKHDPRSIAKRSESYSRNSATRRQLRGPASTLRTLHPKEYRAWAHMRDRCHNPRCHEYANYGGRGITISPRWDTFAVFLEDMGSAPSLELSIDRINNDGNYEPGNCRWATVKVQTSNTRRNRLISAAETLLTMQDWARRLGVHQSTIAYRIDVMGMTPAEAVTVPFKRRKHPDGPRGDDGELL